ncbi:hypothetical protein [Alcanivorax sp. 1008]|uniref:hypothetical protein n=1 Tax=Alcanivorax sp. 1008 TaxID=2816853 RepID=UPI001D63F1F5|nr:hypothetical protein [Alcanivorax sp. 1008]MCC1498092.1 hypothetical protein [Alcanivorax sp. 1008]
MDSIDDAKGRLLLSSLLSLYQKSKGYMDELVLDSEIGELKELSTSCYFRYAGIMMQIDGIGGRSEDALISHTEYSYQAFYAYLVSDIFLRRRSPQTMVAKIVSCRWINAFCAANIKKLNSASMQTVKEFHSFIDTNSSCGLERKYLFINQFIAFLKFLDLEGVICITGNLACTIKKSDFEAIDPTTKEFALRRKKKSIDDDFLYYICKSKEAVYRDDRFSDYDKIMIQSIPFFIGLGLRVGEICSLPLECIVEREDGLYLRVWSEKTSFFNLRYVPAIWKDSVISAVHEIRTLTAKPRMLAESISRGCYANEIMKKARSVISSSGLVRPIVVGDTSNSTFVYIPEAERLGFPRTYIRGRSKVGKMGPLVEIESGQTRFRYAVNMELLLHGLFNDLVKKLSKHYGSSAVYAWQFGEPAPDLFIERKAFRVKQPLEDNLFIISLRQSSSCALSAIPFPEILKPHHFTDFFSSPPNAKTSIFDRVGLERDSGSRIRISPHQFRHWVTSAFHRHGTNDLAVDLWMGRSVGQNRNYDLRTSEERAHRVREVVGRIDTNGISVVGTAKKFIPGDSRSIKSAHLTPWGICSRDLQVSPCERHLSCIKGFGTESGCKNFVFDPDSKEALLEIVKLRDFSVSQQKVVASLKSEMVGVEMVERHLDHHRETIRACDEIIRRFGGREDVKT